MDRYERISFVVPFKEIADLLTPLTSFECDTFPNEISVDFRIGLVGLKPIHRYHVKLLITPYHLTIKVGDSFNMNEAYSESAAMSVDTKGTLLTGNVDGQFTVHMEKIKIVAKGIYKVQCILTDHENDKESELHKLETYFSVDKK